MRIRFRAIVVVSLMLIMPLAHGAVVSRLKADKVPLVDGSGNTVEFLRSNFKDPWTIKTMNADGSISVEVDGKAYTVKPWYVETQGASQLVAPPACLDNQDTRLAATRNVGNACTKK